MKPIDGLAHAARGRASGRKLAKGHRTLDDILAAAKQHRGKGAGRGRHAGSLKSIEATLAAIRAQARAGRT